MLARHSPYSLENTRDPCASTSGNEHGTDDIVTATGNDGTSAAAPISSDSVEMARSDSGGMTPVSSDKALAMLAAEETQDGLFKCNECEYATRVRETLDFHVRLEHQPKTVLSNSRCPCRMSCAPRNVGEAECV